jgi:hypothetical protein
METVKRQEKTTFHTEKNTLFSNKMTYSHAASGGRSAVPFVTARGTTPQ